MPDYDNALQQLKDMHRILKDKNLEVYTLTLDMCESMKKDDYVEMVINFNFMEDKGWITKRILSKDITNYYLTSHGIKTLEGF